MTLNNSIIQVSYIPSLHCEPELCVRETVTAVAIPLHNLKAELSVDKFGKYLIKNTKFIFIIQDMEPFQALQVCGPVVVDPAHL